MESLQLVRTSLYEEHSVKLIFEIPHTAGVILSNEPAPIESRQFGTTDKVNTAGIFGAPSRNNNNNITKEVKANENPVPDVIPVYVNNSLEGQLKIENFEYLDEYSNESSPLFQAMAKDFEQKLVSSLADSRIIRVKVLKMMYVFLNAVNY